MEEVSNLLTCEDHALVQTLLKATILTAISLSFVNFAISVGHASVNALILNGSLEKPFASVKEEVGVI